MSKLKTQRHDCDILGAGGGLPGGEAARPHGLAVMRKKIGHHHPVDHLNFPLTDRSGESGFDMPSVEMERVAASMILILETKFARQG